MVKREIMSSLLRLALTGLFALPFLLLTACNTPSEGDDFNIAPGIVYDDTVHIATAWGLCEGSPRTTAYGGLLYVNATGDTVSRNWLGVSLSASTANSASYAIGTNGSNDDAESPQGKASVLMFRIGGSQETAGARLRVTLFANGDSVRVEGKNILLQNGRTLNFNLTNPVLCQG
jgi:hypothetical protein